MVVLICPGLEVTLAVSTEIIAVLLKKQPSRSSALPIVQA